MDNGAQADLLRSLSGTLSDFQTATAKLDKALAHHSDGDLVAHAKHSRDHVLTAMAEVRSLGDKLELVIADDLWSLPTYREMLFIR